MKLTSGTGLYHADVLRLIEDHLLIFPNSEYGFAHIVLSDKNLEDYWIKHVIEDFHSGQWSRNVGTGTTLEHSAKENKATLLLLDYLLLIAESDRCLPEEDKE